MQTKTFTTGRIRRADFDAANGTLQLLWDNGLAKAYKGVPAEVFRRLCAAPNPTTYWEDRIAEEYPQTQTMVASESAGKATQASLDDLFKNAGL